MKALAAAAKTAIPKIGQVAAYDRIRIKEFS